MSAEHNHPPRCCCRTSRSTLGEFVILDGCDACPDHGDLARSTLSEPLGKIANPYGSDLSVYPTAPYTEQETTNG